MTYLRITRLKAYVIIENQNKHDGKQSKKSSLYRDWTQKSRLFQQQQ